MLAEHMLSTCTAALVGDVLGRAALRLPCSYTDVRLLYARLQPKFHNTGEGLP
jgi:hypothetical protein